MPLTNDPSGPAHLPNQGGGPYIGTTAPPAGGAPALPPGVTPGAIAASQAANPNASSGGYEGVGPTWQSPSGPSTNDIHGFSNSYGGINFPPEVIKVMNKAFDDGLMSGSTTPAQWAWEALRGTDYFKTQFPSYDVGQQNGLYGSWGQYTTWKNNMVQVATQYLGRAPFSYEIDGWASTGRTPVWLANYYTSQANVGTLSDPVKGLFSQDEINQMTAGSITGIQLNAFADWASKAIPLLQQEGLPINRAALEAAYHAGTAPLDYARGQAGISGKFTDYHTVLSPAVLALFSPAEQQELIQTANGVVTPNGATLYDKAGYFAQIIGYSTTYYGTNTFSREQMEQMYNNGVSPSKIAHDASNAEQAAQAAAAEARALAQRMATATADIEAHKQDYNFALTTQGAAGQQGISAEDENNIALQMAGKGNTQGAKLQKMIDDAMLRMKANFSGTLQNLDRNGYGYALGKPDVGA